MTGYTHIPTNDSADFYSPIFKRRHAYCKSWDLEDDRVWSNEERFLSRLKTKEERRKPMLDLRILGACRQLYEEANVILWTTNTFSFEDGPSLQKFIQGLHSTQSKKLNRMHVDMEYYSTSDEQWREALLPSLLSKLTALQTLHITFDQGDSLVSITIGNFDSWLQDQPEPPHPLLAMQALALENVTVVIGDRVYNPPSEISDDPTNLRRNDFRWTIEQKREVAENLRSSLLNGHEWVRQPKDRETTPDWPF